MWKDAMVIRWLSGVWCIERTNFSWKSNMGQSHQNAGTFNIKGLEFEPGREAYPCTWFAWSRGGGDTEADGIATEPSMAS